ncbi:DUF2721 domain-containing protein [Sphingomicrobium lutaoense]|uniref:Heme exporter protein D n=1 Tax=Sphingomicrobium lutaoense TaxID=515949 RepID=A0A839YXE1_9SPHN|nr:DUF2721 domain-containing protein [Sphingomicrobium lutaoense]MBB3762988.1 heme exporter protein D [Sphingomicrobium lutaoense]
MDWIEASLAADFISRTSNTARVQAILQLSLAPVFLLAAIGAFLNVMNARLIWIADRVHRLDHQQEAENRPRAVERELEELPALRRRLKYAQISINLSTLSALVISGIVALLFISAFVRPAMGSYVAFLWVAAMGLLVAALTYFLLETRLATTTARQRRRLSRQIESKRSGS